MLAEPRDPTVTTLGPVDDECGVAWHEHRLIHPISPINADKHVTGCDVGISDQLFGTSAGARRQCQPR